MLEEKSWLNWIREGEKRMSNNWVPLAGRILAKRKDDVETSQGGIIIPENAKEKQSEGTVIVVGGERTDAYGKKVPVQLVEGDRIIFGKYAGVEVKIDHETYLTMKEEEVLMRLPKQKEE